MGDGSHDVFTEEVPRLLIPGASTQQLQRMDRFEAHLAQLASWLHGREALLKSLQELLRRGMTEK